MPRQNNSIAKLKNLIELKALDTTVNLAASSAGALILLNGLVKGDNLDQRQGRKVFASQISIRLSCNSTTGTGVNQIHRVFIVADRQSNGTAPVITDVLTSITVFGLPNLDNRLRFRILWDKTYVLSKGDDPNSFVYESLFLPLSFNVIFNSGNAGTIADLATNSLYLMVIGSEAAGVTAGTCLARARYTFADA